MCGCDLRYPGYICDYHRRELERTTGHHTPDCYGALTRTEFERRRDEGED